MGDMEKAKDYEYKPGRAAGKKGSAYDDCQTPPYAVEPLMPYLKAADRVLYDPAEGDGVLLRAMEQYGADVIGSDIKTGTDFFKLRAEGFDTGHTIVTNPPYSLKYEWMLHCFMLDEPFALLMPLEVLGSIKAQNMFTSFQPGIKVMFTQPRVDFCMPNQMWSGNGAQFPVAWFTWKIPLPGEMTFVRLNKPKRADLALYWMDALQIDTATLATPWFKPSRSVYNVQESASARMAKDVKSWKGVALMGERYEWNDDGCRLWYEIERSPNE